MSLALKARQRARRKGGSRERLFGCDLREHLQRSGQDVPQVLRSCTEFVEQHGVVDGIYRLSGVSSNIQRLRAEFEAQRSPELARPVYLQDVHCVSSLCKAYCRELPNPLLTYQLYDKFADAVAIQMEEARLVKIKEVLKELPVPHYRTLEFLMRHLLRMAGHSGRTNMHARNLAIVWAPNLLRSRDIEASGFNGTAAFMEVRVQSIVVEFILTHVEQLFGDAPLRGGDSPRRSLLLPGGTPPLHVPATLSQGDGPPQMRPYHTIIELGEHRRKGSLKAKKWRSIFNLGRSGHEAKRKPGKAEEKEEKCGKVSLRPAKSMDSLSSGPCGPPGADTAGLLPKLSVKLRPQRQQSSDAAPALPESHPELDESLEEPLEAAAESSTKSEPTTPKAPRAGPGLSGRSRAEKCAGLHISGPFSVTVPFHITSNLSRLTRGLPCPALEREPAPDSPPEPARDPRSCSEDAEQTRLSLELRDSFAFLDCPETWLEGGGDAEAAARSPGMEDGTPGMEDGTPGIGGETPGIEDESPGIGDESPGIGEGFPAVEEGMESGFMNPGERRPEQPDSYLSIEECTEQDMFFLAPGASDPDSDSDEIFLSAHDELSPLGAAPDSPEGPPGVGMAPEIPEISETLEIPEILKIPKVPEIPEMPTPKPLGKGGPGVGDPPRDPHGEGGEEEGAAEGASSPRTGMWDEGGVVGGPAGNGGEDGAGSRPLIPGEGNSRVLEGSPPAPSPAEPPREPPIPGAVPEVVPDGAGVTPTSPSPPASAPAAPPKNLELSQDQDPQFPEPPRPSEPPKFPELIQDEPPRPPNSIQDEPPKNLEPVYADPPKSPELPGHPEPPGPLELVQEEPPKSLEPIWDDPHKSLELIQDEPPRPPEPPKSPQTPNPPKPIWDEPPKSLELIQDEPPRFPEPPRSPGPNQDEPPRFPEPPKSLELIQDEPPRFPEPPGPLDPIWDEPPRALKAIQDDAPKSWDPPEPLELIQDESPKPQDPPGSPKLIWDGRPKSLEPILADPPKSWDTPRPLEPILADPPKSRDTPGALEPILADPPKSWDTPRPLEPIRDGRPKSLEPILADPPKSWDTPKSLEPILADPPKSRDTPKSLEPILADPPKSWDTPRPLKAIQDDAPKSRDTPRPLELIRDGRPKSLEPILADPPKSWDTAGTPKLLRDGRPKSLEPVPFPPRSSRRPLPILGGRVLLARAVPVVPPKPHFARALLGPPGTPESPPGTPLGLPWDPPRAPPGAPSAALGGGKR
ncbi:rho GTPase-activating protein 30 isoform X2 [Corvus hawaiiensis]|uniref:rho GTPase-activating protein 30 isoform X2 n=1 Tax=Corvus hawaiiensis TaxID=134902 RepID=UPI0020189012|nr:rho GTPase-activating protein 30 isoform X2 [Corvus hawaiiensis]